MMNKKYLKNRACGGLTKEKDSFLLYKTFLRAKKKQVGGKAKINTVGDRIEQQPELSGAGFLGTRSPPGQYPH